MVKPVVLLRGLPGSGKTTTSALIRDRLQPSVRVSNDDIRYLAAPRDFDLFSVEASEDACMVLAMRYAERGFHAVVDGVFADLDLLDSWRQVFLRRNIPFFVVTLTIELADLLLRNRARPELARMSEDRLRLLHSSLQTTGWSLQVDGSLPEEIASDVIDHMGSDVSRLDGGDSMEILFLRHGSPDYPDDIFPDHMCMGLSNIGRAEARSAQFAVDRFSPDIIFASDMARAVETARIACPERKFEVSSKLRERTFPKLFGRSICEIRRDYGQAVEPMLRGNSDLWEPLDAETLESARRRVFEFFSELQARGDVRRVLVIGHGGPHSWLVEAALGIDLKGNRALNFDTGHFSKFIVKDSVLEISFINRTADDVV